MRPIIYIIAILILIPVIAIGALAVILANPDLYRQQLSDTFETETGFVLDINGDIGWRYWPLIALNVSDVEIRPVAAGEPIATLKSASVDLELLPLLMGSNNIAIDGIFIDQLKVNLQVDKAGNANWVTTTETDAEEAPDDTTEGGGTTFGLDIAVIEITDARLEYRDLAASQHYIVDIPSLTTGAVFYDEPVDINGVVRAEDKLGEMTVQTEIDGAISFNQGFTRFTFRDLGLDSRVSGANLADLQLVAVLTGDFDTEQDRASLEESSLTLNDLTAKFSLSVNDLSGSPHFAGSVTTNTFNARRLLETLEVELPEMANADALTKLEFSTNLTGTMPEVHLENLLAKWDQSILKGNVGLVLEEKTGIDFDLALDRINMSDYLPPTPDVDSETTGGSQEAAPPEDFEVIPVELLNQYEVTGNLQVDAFTYDTYELSNVKLDLANRDRQLKANMQAAGYSGNIEFSTTVTTGNAASGNLNVTVRGLDITALTEWEWITGTFNVSSETRFQGTRLSNILESISGPTRFDIQDGTLDVTPIKKMAADIDAIRGKTSSVSEWPDRMSFERLDGQHQLNNGIAENQVFAFNVENLNVTGQGGVDYWNNQLAYDIDVALEETESGRFTVNPHLAGIKWPLHCEGAMDASPVDTCRPDSAGIKDMIAQAAKQQVKRKADEKIEEKKEELRDKVKDRLKGLFNP